MQRSEGGGFSCQPIKCPPPLCLTFPSFLSLFLCSLPLHTLRTMTRNQSSLNKQMTINKNNNNVCDAELLFLGHYTFSFCVESTNITQIFLDAFLGRTVRNFTGVYKNIFSNRTQLPLLTTQSKMAVDNCVHLNLPVARKKQDGNRPCQKEKKKYSPCLAPSEAS